jgi:hypothetical protein
MMHSKGQQMMVQVAQGPPPLYAQQQQIPPSYPNPYQMIPAANSDLGLPGGVSEGVYPVVGAPVKQPGVMSAAVTAVGDFAASIVLAKKIETDAKAVTSKIGAIKGGEKASDDTKKSLTDIKKTLTDTMSKDVDKMQKALKAVKPKKGNAEKQKSGMEKGAASLGRLIKKADANLDDKADKTDAKKLGVAKNCTNMCARMANMCVKLGEASPDESKTFDDLYKSFEALLKEADKLAPGGPFGWFKAMASWQQILILVGACIFVVCCACITWKMMAKMFPIVLILLLGGLGVCIYFIYFKK